MVRTLAAALAALLALPALAETKVVVIPFAALQGDVPPKAGEKVAGLLAEELKGQEGVSSEVGGQGEKETAEPTLRAAQADVARAIPLLDAGKPREAAKLLVGAVERMFGPAAALADANEIADALSLLARARFQAADDEGGTAALRAAVRIAPARELAAVKGSPRFARIAGEEKDRGIADKAQLRVDSVPSGAGCEVDGHDLGRTSLLIQSVPAGEHLVKVSFPSGDVWAAKVTVTGKDEPTRVLANVGGVGPAGRVAGALSKNTISPVALAAAKEALGAAKADAVVFGGLSRGGKGLFLDAFVYGKDGSLKRLPRATFDEELIGAGSDLAPAAAGFAAGSSKEAKEGETIAREVRVSSSEENALKRTYPVSEQAEETKDSGPRRVITGPGPGGDKKPRGPTK
jgi:hypothetical protein